MIGIGGQRYEIFGLTTFVTFFKNQVKPPFKYTVRTAQ